MELSGNGLSGKICPGAGKPFPIRDSIKTLIEQDFADLPDEYRGVLPPFKEFYHASPTDECPTGLRGRLGVYEILRMDKKLEQVVLKEPVDSAIHAVARSNGMLTMREDAILKALEVRFPLRKLTPLEGTFSPETISLDLSDVVYF